MRLHQSSDAPLEQRTQACLAVLAFEIYLMMYFTLFRQKTSKKTCGTGTAGCQSDSAEREREREKCQHVL